MGSLSGVSLSREISVQGGLCPGSLCGDGGSLSRGLCLGVSVQGISVQGVSVHEGLFPGGSLSRGISVQGGLCPRGSLSWGDGWSLSGDLCPGVSLHRHLSQWDLCLGGSLSREVSVRENPPYGKERAVHILLECIFVVLVYTFTFYYTYRHLISHLVTSYGLNKEGNYK